MSIVPVPKWLCPPCYYILVEDVLIECERDIFLDYDGPYSLMVCYDNCSLFQGMSTISNLQFNKPVSCIIIDYDGANYSIKTDEKINS